VSPAAVLSVSEILENVTVTETYVKHLVALKVTLCSVDARSDIQDAPAPP